MGDRMTIRAISPFERDQTLRPVFIGPCRDDIDDLTLLRHARDLDQVRFIGCASCRFTGFIAGVRQGYCAADDQNHSYFCVCTGRI